MTYALSSHSGISAVRLLMDALHETGVLSPEQFKDVVQHMQSSAREAAGRSVDAEDYYSIARMLAVFDEETGG